MIPAVRPLSAIARRIQLRKVASYEVARLRARAAKAAPQPDPAAPVAVEDEPATVAVPFETMESMVFGNRNNVQEAA